MKDSYHVFNLMNTEQMITEVMTEKEREQVFRRFQDRQSKAAGAGKERQHKASGWVGRIPAFYKAAVIAVLILLSGGSVVYAWSGTLSRFWQKTLFSEDGDSATNPSDMTEKKKNEAVKSPQYVLDENGFLSLLYVPERPVGIDTIRLSVKAGRNRKVTDAAVREVREKNKLSEEEYEAPIAYGISAYVPELMEDGNATLQVHSEVGEVSYTDFTPTETGMLCWKEAGEELRLSKFGIVVHGTREDKEISAFDRLIMEDAYPELDGKCILVNQDGSKEKLQISRLCGTGGDMSTDWLMQYSPDYEYREPGEGKVWGQSEYERFLHSITTKVFDLEAFDRLETVEGEVLLDRKDALE